MTKALEHIKRLQQTLPLEWAQRQALAKALEDGNPLPVVLRGGTVAKGADTFDEERGTGIFQITTPTVDRFDDVVVPEGMVNENYRKNPVVLWNHDDSRPPIGMSLGEEVHDTGVLSEVLFDRKNDPDGFNAKIFGQYVDGFMNADSIRFLPLQAEKRVVEDKETSTEIWGGGFTYNSWELLEHSAVPLPANPDALALAAPAVLALAERTGVLSPAGMELLKGMRGDYRHVLDHLNDVQDLLEELKAALPADGPPAGPVAPIVGGRGGRAATNEENLASLNKALAMLRTMGDEARAK